MYNGLVKQLRDFAVELRKAEDALLVRDAAEAIEELICEVADEHNARLDAEERQRWIPVTEQLPEEKINPNTRDFEYVLCTTIWGDVRPFKYGTPIGNKDAHFWNGAGYVDAYVTHWMPLPSTEGLSLSPTPTASGL